MSSRRILGMLIVAFVAAVIPAQAQVFVDIDSGACDDAGSGTMQAPFCTIQAAYDFATDGAQIRVMPGTYEECVFLFDIATQKSIELVADAWITSSDNTVTIIDASNVAAVDCEFPASQAPASVVNIGGTASEFTGFTVTGGTASGIFGVGSVVITHNVVQNNSSSIGGGIYVYSGNCYYGDTAMSITDNQISNNSADGQGGGVSIAAGLVGSATDPDPVTCPMDGNAVINFTDNTVDDNTAASNGGGIYATVFTNDRRQATVAITSNMINRNSASSDSLFGYGAGIYGLTYGYGTERIEVVDNDVTNNATLDFGGGVRLDVFPTIVDSAIDHQHLVQNNRITDNSAGRGGGGMELFASVLDMNPPQAFSMIVDENIISNNVVGTINTLGLGPLVIDDLNDSFGGGGLLATFESLTSSSTRMEFKIEDNTIDGNTAKLLGGGVGLYLIADAEPPGAASVSQADALIEFSNNQVTRNSTDSGVRESVGGGVFAFLTAHGRDASADVDTTLNTIASNTLDNQVEPGGFHVESLTSPDSQTATDGQASLTLDSAIILDNDGIGFGGPTPGQPGVKSPGGTAEFSVITRYNDLFGNVLGDLDGWIISGTGNIFSDPLLDAAFDPDICSPTIDAANPILDFSLEPGPNGGRANMGSTGGTIAAQRSMADVNGDGEVDGIDLVRLSVAYGTSATEDRYNAAVDFDDSGLVGGNDLSLMAADFGRVCPQ